jgi:cytochrome P450
MQVKHHIIDQVDGTHRASFQPVQKPCVILDNRAYFLLTPIIETVSSMYSLFLALVLFPQVQRRAQAELDEVIGRDRLPSFDDRPRLPYIEALCKELMRWQMVTPMGALQSFPWSL